MQRSVLALIVSLVGCTNFEVYFKVGQKDEPLYIAIDDVTEEKFKKHLGYLASDELEGRLSGYPGNDTATEYIAAIFKEAKLKPVGDADSNGKPTYFQHFKLPRKNPKTKEDLWTRNCVGLLEGSDEKLKKEIVVLGAHHDHVGKFGQLNISQLGLVKKDDEGKIIDDIWNGACDNGSGASTVITLVQAVGKSNLRAKRSILFMTFSGEEWGLLGSKHYVLHPIFPLNETVAMINLDMVGRGNNTKPSLAYGMKTAEKDFFMNIVEKASKLTGLKVSYGDEVIFASDSASFRRANVPTMGFSQNGAGSKDQYYHRVNDHADRIDYDYITLLGKTCLVTLFEIANSAETPKWSNLPLPKSSEGRIRLGITPGDLSESEAKAIKLAKDQGAIKIDEVDQGSAAERAGIKPGDIMVTFAGKTFPKDDEVSKLFDYYKDIKREVEYPIEVYRKAKTEYEKVTLKISWPKEVEKFRIGFTPGELSDDELKGLKLAQDQGAIKVESVEKDLPGDKAGLKEGDIIISFMGKTFPVDRPVRKLVEYFTLVKLGEEFQIQVVRNGKTVVLKTVWQKETK